MLKRIFLFGILMIMGLMSEVRISLATITVTGTQSGTWLATNSPYIVTGTVIVELGNTLTIEPGVVVKFATGTSLISYGFLNATGEETNKIVFTSFKDETNGQGTSTIAQAGDWNGIKVSGNGGNGSIIKYCVIKYGQQAIYLENVINVIINNNVIANHKGDDGIGVGNDGGIASAISLFSADSNVIENNTIMNIIGGKGGDGAYPFTIGGNGGKGIGILLNSSEKNKISSNNIYDIQGGQGGFWNITTGEGIGIFISSSNNNELYENNIMNITGGLGGDNWGNGGIGVGLYLYDANHNNVKNNSFLRIGGGDGGRGLNLAGKGMSAGGDGIGVYLMTSMENTILYNNISHNKGGQGGEVVPDAIGDAGVGGVGGGIYLGSSTRNTISFNTISYNKGGQGGTSSVKGMPSSGGAGGIGYGIYFLSSIENTIIYNTISNNRGGQGGKSDYSQGGPGNIGGGILLSFSTSTIIVRNIILDNRGGEGGPGGSSMGSGGVGCGVYLISSDNNTIINDNTFKDNTGGTGNPNGNGVGIYCKSSVISELIYNNIYNNQPYNLQTDGTQTAEYNWWGSDPPATSTFSGNIDYDPWLKGTYTSPTITEISPTAGTIGTLVIIKGRGYIPTEGVQINFGTTLTITSVTTDLSGKFTAIFTTDTQPYGTTSIIATELLTGKKANGFFFITGGRIYILTPISGTVGTIITLSGNGYGRTEDIVIHFGTIRSIATSIASDAGTFSTTFTFPLMVRGTKTVTATGLKTLVSANAFFNVLCSTRLEIKPGSKIVTKGDEFGIDIWLKDVVNLAGLDVFLDFDHNRLEVLDDNPVEEGIQITQGPFPPEASLLYAAATNTSGQIAYSLILVPATNTADGSGILAKIRFKAKAPGTATIYFVFDKPDNRWTVLKDSDNQPIPVTTYGGTVTIFEYGSMEGYVIIDPPKDTGTNAGISITLVGVGTTSTGIGGYYTFLEVIPGTYTLQADTLGVALGTITGIVVYPGTKTIVATLTLLNGDSNNDGVVDIEDFMVLRNAYLSVIGDGRWNEESDYNGDERINIDDAMILRNSFFKTQPSPAPAPPAPAPPVKLPVKLAKTKLTFSPSAIDTFVGATFSVRIMIENVEDLAACQAQLSFDPNLLEVINLTTGNIGLPVIKSQFGVDTVDYAGGLLEGKVYESGILAEIEFKVKDSGITEIKFDFNPAKYRMTKMIDINSQAILFDVNEVKVNAKAISPLDHFEFDKIDSPKVDGIPFNVTIKALDIGNKIVDDYNNTGTLSLHNISGTITPKVITFGSGTWQGTVAISGTGTQVFICVRSSGKVGTSSLFEVKAINVPKESNEDILIKSEDEKAVVVIEKGSPNQDAYVEITKVTTPPSVPPNIPQDVSPVVIEINVVTAPKTKLEIKGSITLSYTDEQVKGLDESRLRIFYYTGSGWELAASNQEVDTFNNRITAYITHFSIYAIGNLVAPNLSNVQVYPNPFKPTTVHSGKYITFKNLTSYWNLKIFNLAGELVDEKTGDTNEAHWDGNNQAGNSCASGVYIYLITNDRNEKVTGRVVVIR